MRKLKIILNSKLLIIILLFITLFRLISINNRSIYNGDEKDFICTVISINKNNTLLKCNELVETKTIEELQIGDIIKINGYLEEFKTNTNFNLFNYREYQNNKGIYYRLNINKYEIIDESNDIVLSLKRMIKNRIKDYESKDYLESFLLGDKSYINDDIEEIYNSIGIIHLFAISGMHVSIIIELFDKLYKKNNYRKKSLLYLFLLIYYKLINSISLLRSLVFVIVKDINKLFNVKLSNKKIVLLSVLLILIIKPSAYKESGFYYSLIISAGIYLNNKKIDNKLLKALYISFLAFILSLPLNIYLYSEINLLTIIYNIIFIPIISIIIFPLSILSFFLPFLDNILFSLLNMFEVLASTLNTISIKLIFIKPEIIYIIIYYLIVFISLMNKKYFIILISILFIHYNIYYFINNKYILFLDVSQGDSIIIHDKYNVLIDTGGWNNSDYNISKNITIKVLKSFGIRKLDYLILTHGDYDHMGEAINLVNNYKVDKVIFNCGSFNDIEKDLIEVLNNKHIKHYSCIKELDIGDILYFLNTKKYDNENDYSNVIYTEINNNKFLFMGDASYVKEKDILNKYNISNVDVLKVGHHGSKTSSGKEFIDEINPKYGIISVGKNNRYGHPNKIVLNNLKNSIIYRTDNNGSIYVNITNNELIIKTCK